MATSSTMFPLELLSAQEHIPMCEKHGLRIDMTCEDCEVFICSQCAKTDHKDHDWTTVSTAGSLRRRELKKILSKVKEEDVKEMDEKIKKVCKQMEKNEKLCDNEVFKLQKHYDAIVLKLDEIKKNYEIILEENLQTKNAKVGEKKINLEKKNEKIKALVKFLKERHNTMSDYSLIDNLRDLKNLKLKKERDLEKEDFSVRYRRGVISEGLLESMIGQTLDLDDIIVSARDSIKYGCKSIFALEAISEDACFLCDVGSDYFERINIRNKKKEKMYRNTCISDVCLADNGDVYVADYRNKSIVRLSPTYSVLHPSLSISSVLRLFMPDTVVRQYPSDLVSTVFSTAPLEPIGICQSADRGLLVTLKDNESRTYQLDSKSRRLVRHVTPAGDVIREYEYQEDGQTRLFTLPYRVAQNGRADICVVNRTSIPYGELVIISSSGSLKSVYQGKNQGLRFNPLEVVCDSHCNIIVCEYNIDQVHLLNPYGEFLKYLLTENEVTHPSSMSLYKSTLWVGNTNGLVKVFQYNNNT